MKIRAFLQMAVMIALGIAFALPAASQDKKSDAQLRTIRGTVLDKDENPRPSGVVYLAEIEDAGGKNLYRGRCRQLPLQRARSQRRLRSAR